MMSETTDCMCCCCWVLLGVLHLRKISSKTQLLLEKLIARMRVPQLRKIMTCDLDNKATATESMSVCG